MLYLTTLAESTYLVGEAMGEKGSVIPAWIGAVSSPVSAGFVILMLTADKTPAEQAFRLGTAIAPLTTAWLYHESAAGWVMDVGQDGQSIGQLGGSALGMAAAGIVLKELGKGRELNVPIATILTAASTFSAYGTGVLTDWKGQGLHETLWGGFTPAAFGASAGALLGADKDAWEMGYAIGGIGFSGLSATLGYQLTKTERRTLRLSQTTAGYYGMATLSGLILWASRKPLSSRNAFLLATGMTFTGTVMSYVTGQAQDATGGLNTTLIGGFTPPTGSVLVASYLGLPANGYDEVFRVGAFLAPFTATWGYHLNRERFEEETDNADVFTAEILGGYFAGGLATVPLNYSAAEWVAKSSFKRRFLHSVLVTLASGFAVWAIGEQYGSGEGELIDSLKGAFAAPVGLSAIPLIFGGMNVLGGYPDTHLRMWDDAFWIGSLVSPISATFMYNGGGPERPKSQLRIVLPTLQVRF